jgi:hypothetical protein
VECRCLEEVVVLLGKELEEVVILQIKRSGLAGLDPL